jgi:type I restriction enzyme, S subunit
MSTATTHIKTEKQLIPALRFKEFQGEWEKKNLGDVGKVKMCKRIFSNQTSEEGDIPFFKIGTFGKEPDAFIPKELYDEFRSKYSFPKIGDILMSASGTLGRTVIYDGMDAYYQDSNIVWIDNKEGLITNEFLYYVYQIVRYESEGGTIQRLYNSIIAAAQFCRPSLPEQQKIASFLSAVDEKIQQLTTKKVLLEQYKKGVMQQLFSGQIRFKDENGNPYPDWEEKRLGVIADKVNKKNKDKSVNFVLTNSATQGIVSQSDYFDRDIANQNNLEGYYVVEVNDFVYNPRISVHAPVGPVKRNKLKEGVMSPLYTVFRFKDVDLIYLECFFSTIVWHKYLNSVANFGARHDRMNISQQDFFKMPIPFPCEKEQQKIATYLSSIDTKIESVNNQITQTQTFKKGLLQQMFVAA